MKTKFYLTIISLLFVHAASAQMVPVGGGNEAFLQGLYSEVGVTRCGVYGAQSTPPGYNANMGALGFVADHEMNGWNIAGPGQPVRCGDYFYPGSPYEAWGLQVNGVVYGNWNAGTSCDGSVGGGIPGDVTFYSGTGGYKVGQWEGDIINGSTNLHICQYTAVPDSELYFSTTVTIKNNGVSAVNNVYYVRHVDPDNEQPYSFSFNTNNLVVANPGVGSLSHVSATGQMYGCYLGMLATGYPDARAFIGGGVGSFPTLISDCWNGISGYNTTVGANNGGFDDCMGISNRWTTIPAGESVVFTFYYVLDPSAINAAINAANDANVYINGNLALSQGGIGGGGSVGSGCSTPGATTDTVNFRGFYCPGQDNLIEIDAPASYSWNWVPNPDITILSPANDSVIINPSTGLDSTTYQVNGMYLSGTDTVHTVLLVTLIEENPNADFSYNVACVDMQTCFTDHSTTHPESSIESWTWDFDEAPVVGNSPDTCVHLSDYRVHDVQLIVETEWGCKDTVIKPVEVFDTIPVDFIYDPACKDSLTHFQDATVYGDTTLTNWTWDFGTVPATGSNLQNPAHAYTTVANYNVTLIIENAVGCIDTVVKQIAVYPTPTVDFSADPLFGCAPLHINFTDLSSGDTTDIVAWEWDFGDGNTSNLQNPDNTYLVGAVNNSIFHDVTLTVTSEHGCQATLTKPNYIRIAPYPEAEFTINSMDPELIVGNVIQFVDLSVANIDTWQWDFGDGGNSNIQFPAHTYETPDTFTVTLIVHNTDGCMDTISHDYTIVEEYVLYCPNSFTPNDNGLNEEFRAYGTGIVEFKMTIFDRWGRELFVSNDITKGWSGKQQNGKGDYYKSGVYPYLIEAKDMKGRSHRLMGHVNLIK